MGDFLGDSDRVRYVLSCLVKNAIERNNEFDNLDLVKVRGYISEEITVYLYSPNDQTHYEKRQLVIKITD